MVANARLPVQSFEDLSIPKDSTHFGGDDAKRRSRPDPLPVPAVGPVGLGRVGRRRVPDRLISFEADATGNARRLPNGSAAAMTAAIGWNVAPKGRRRA
jgi:hypothetical protein